MQGEGYLVKVVGRTARQRVQRFKKQLPLRSTLGNSTEIIANTLVPNPIFEQGSLRPR